MKKINHKILVVGQYTEDAKQCLQILKKEGYQVELITVVDESPLKKNLR